MSIHAWPPILQGSVPCKVSLISCYASFGDWVISKFTEIIEKERLIGLMNNTKWNALFSELNLIEEMIQYKAHYIDGSMFPDHETSYEFTPELQQIWGNFIAIEYVDVITIIKRDIGKLLEPEIVDVTKAILEICNEHNVKVSVINSGVRVWGYHRHGEILELL
ncbi:DUF6678 family protein [Shewanella sp. Isolate11]|uniref:DUF6678 family protein n=1 Tax=Shewanella sp. Isolate11 TaxID=2908530 RepID=UPI001EFEF0C7|nr:DUF6678 family protein [Shewanella sp. Isolate11]MCG9697924.1 hypothetical protein [Shewanella sp. Isolate11]